MPNYTNDDDMAYDLKRHRYTLTKQALLDLKGVDLEALFSENPDRDIPAFLDRVSQSVYSYVLGLARDAELTQYMLSLPHFREGIRDALAEQAFDIAINRTDPGAFFAGTGVNELVTPIVRAMLLDSGVAFRGKYAQQSYPTNWMEKKGVDW